MIENYSYLIMEKIKGNETLPSDYMVKNEIKIIKII